MLPSFHPSIAFTDLLTPLDWAVFIALQLLTVGAVIYGHYRKRSATVRKDAASNVLDIMLMGRQLTLPLFVATLVATWYGGIFGVTEIAFNDGIYNFVTQGAFWYVTYLIFAFCIAHKVHAFKAVTLPELVGRMFGPRSARLSAVFNFFNILPIVYAISIGLFLQMIFGGSLMQMMALSLVFVVIYTMWGGFRAVVFSDVIQCFVMCASVAIVLFWSIATLGGWTFLRTHLPASHFSPTGRHTWAETLVWGFVALSTLVNPDFYQRCFAAKTAKIARWGIVLSTVIWFGFDICTTAGGMYARAVIPDAASDTAYMNYALQLLPPGLRGFMLAGIFATILSTLDAFLFIAGNTITYDLAPSRWKGRVWLQRVGIAVAGLVSILLARHFGGNIATIWKTLGSYAAASLLLPMMIGFACPGRIRDDQFVLASLLGAIGITLWPLLPHTGLWIQVDALYIGAGCTALGLCIYPLLAHWDARKKQSRRPT